MASQRRVWWVYMLRRGDGALYTGIALDVARRLEQHREGVGSKALRGRGPLQLVWQQRVGTQAAALRLERRLKRLRKAQKERWVASCGGTTADHAASRRRRGAGGKSPAASPPRS